MAPQAIKPPPRTYDLILSLFALYSHKLVIDDIALDEYKATILVYCQLCCDSVNPALLSLVVRWFRCLG